jgi:hypothetical protein
MTETSDIIVRRCTVRVIRHGGWSWGPQPRRLVDQVLAALPGLIAERLGELAPEGAADIEIAEPVRIAVSLTLTDLLAGRFDPRQHAAVAAESLPEASPVPDSAPPRFGIHPYRTPLLEHTLANLARGQFLTLAEFLGGLAERGELIPILALLPVTTLEAWYQTLAASAAGTPGPPPAAAPAPAGPSFPDGTRDPVTSVPARLPRAPASARPSRARRLRDAIAAIAAQAGHQTASGPLQLAASATGPVANRAPAGPPSVRQSSAGPAHARPLAAPSSGAASPAAGSAASKAPADPAPAGPLPATAVPPENSSAAASTASGAPVGATKRAIAEAAAGTLVRAASVSAAVTSSDISSALPFLLLGPLAQVGYLPALTPALQPAGLESQTAAFATALAYTVLGPLERGWQHQPEDMAAAAAFAGLAAPMPAPELTEFARVAGPVLPGLDAVVTRALAEGHTAGEPLVLTGGRDGLLLADREGMFPVAWTDTVAGLLSAWNMCGSPPVLVAPHAVAALAELADAGISFVVAAPPARGELWRRLPHGLWTNNHENPALARCAGGYQQAVDLATELIRVLARERAAVPLADGPALGRSLLLAGGLGLGTLAWTLWRKREPTDPLLALERFADLGARVTVEPERVRVRLPLGPRHSDLSAHGLLADVPGVPWFGGRVVEFSGG